MRISSPVFSKMLGIVPGAAPLISEALGAAGEIKARLLERNR
jgi:hypothetical protein